MIEEHTTIRTAGIIRESIVDGPGFRFVVFAQGCPHDCYKCHNKETHPFDGGKETDINKIMEEIEKDPLLQGVTFSGGEPLCQPENFLSLAKKVKDKNLDVVIFTGYTYEEILDLEKNNIKIKELMDICDLLIDGRFEWDKRDLSLKFRGSSNQRIIDMRETRKTDKIIISEKYTK